MQHEGHDEGHDDGRSEGHDEGHDDGRGEGHDQDLDLSVPVPRPTGDPDVDAAMRELADGVRASTDGETRVAGFEAAHRALQDRLADVEG